MSRGEVDGDDTATLMTQERQIWSAEQGQPGFPVCYLIPVKENGTIGIQHVPVETFSIPGAGLMGQAHGVGSDIQLVSSYCKPAI